MSKSGPCWDKKLDFTCLRNHSSREKRKRKMSKIKETPQLHSDFQELLNLQVSVEKNQKPMLTNSNNYNPT